MLAYVLRTSFDRDTNAYMLTIRSYVRLKENAKKAEQHLSLVGGGCKAAFEPQEEALRNIRQSIFDHLGVSTGPKHVRSGTINLRRRVFTKARIVPHISTPLTHRYPLVRSDRPINPLLLPCCLLGITPMGR